MFVQQLPEFLSDTRINGIELVEVPPQLRLHCFSDSGLIHAHVRAVHDVARRGLRHAGERLSPRALLGGARGHGLPHRAAALAREGRLRIAAIVGKALGEFLFERIGGTDAAAVADILRVLVGNLLIAFPACALVRRQILLVNVMA